MEGRGLVIFAAGEKSKESLVVELWNAPLPRPLSTIAWHHWFVVHEETAATTRHDRWEVWQSQNAGGVSVGHVHKNLMRFDGEVGGGPAQCVFIWRDAEAENLQRVLESSQKRYPYRFRYAAWPGPNSNTFAAWVLKVAGLSGDAAILLGPQAIGKKWWDWQAIIQR